MFSSVSTTFPRTSPKELAKGLHQEKASHLLLSLNYFSQELPQGTGKEMVLKLYQQLRLRTSLKEQAKGLYQEKGFCLLSLNYFSQYLPQETGEGIVSGKGSPSFSQSQLLFLGPTPTAKGLYPEGGSQLLSPNLPKTSSSGRQRVYIRERILYPPQSKILFLGPSPKGQAQSLYQKVCFSLP